MNMKTTKEILNEIIYEKQLKKRTVIAYEYSIKYFEKECNITIPELIEKQTIQRKEGVLWKDTLLKSKLIQYRNYLYANFSVGTAKLYYSKIIALLNHCEVEMGKIKPIKTKSKELKLVGDLPTREELKLCINCVNAPIIKALTLFLISTGLSPVDALKLTIEDYINLTQEHHNYTTHHNIRTAIHEMKDKDIVIMITGHREKTGEPYITFVSHEAIKAINLYILSLSTPFHVNDMLFNRNMRSLQSSFAHINDKLELGVTRKGERRFTMRSLRSYHDTQLKKAGLDIGEINILSGRKNNEVIYESYLEIDEQELHDKFIKALPYLLIEDVNKVKTELEITQSELQIAQKENKDLKESINQTYERLNNIEARQQAWEKLLKKHGVDEK